MTAHSTKPFSNALRQMRKQKGMALVEALVASAVLGLGLAGATRLTLHSLQTASDTRQHSVAHTLALDAMECMQSGRSICNTDQVVTVQGVAYTIKTQSQARVDLALTDLSVRVQWPRWGRPQTTNGQAQGAQNLGQFELHSSRDGVPSWVGVSSP